jgi:hypothetical protein
MSFHQMQHRPFALHHTVFKASPGAAIFGQDMHFGNPFLADWKKIGEHRQWLTDCDTTQENKGKIDYDNQVHQKVHVQTSNGILCKPKSRYLEEPWTIMSVHTKGM